MVFQSMQAYFILSGKAIHWPSIVFLKRNLGVKEASLEFCVDMTVTSLGLPTKFVASIYLAFRFRKTSSLTWKK